MFLGTYQHALDAKGRVSIPARYRDLLARAVEPGLVLTICHADATRCVEVYPREPFARFTDKLMESAAMDAGIERLARAVLTSSVEASFDRQGRILVPAGLRKLPGLERDVTWAGLGDRMEIWDRAKWEAVAAKDLAEVSSLSSLFTKFMRENR